MPSPTSAIASPDLAVQGLAKAVSAHLKGDPAAALKALEASAPAGANPEIRAARAFLRLELKQYAEAAAEYKILLEARPTYAEGHYQCGVCLSHTGNFEEAYEHFSKSAELDASHADAPLGMGICLLNLKRPEEALDAFRKCLEKTPGLEAALLGKAVALQLNWEMDDALEIYRVVLERNPRCEEALVNLVALGMQRKDHALVRTYAMKLLALSPTSQAALEGLSSSAFAGEDYPEAVTHYTRLTELFPRNYDYWFNLGVTWQRLGKVQDAGTAYTKAAALRPDLAAPHINMAVLHSSRNDAASAYQSLSTALTIAPERDDLRYQLAVAGEQLGRTEEAENIYTDLVSRNPGDENAQFRLGYLRLEHGDAKGAVASFLACLHKRPAWSDAEINLGLAYWKAGQPDQARAVLEKLVEREPNSIDAVRGLAVNSLAQDDAAESLKWHQRLQELGDRSAEVLHNTGLLLFRTGDPPGAIRNYREAIAARPDFAEALLNLGHAQEASGMRKEARENWSQALDLKPALAQGYFLTDS